MNTNADTGLYDRVDHAKKMMPELDFISLASLSDIDMVARYGLCDSGGVEYIFSRIFFEGFESEGAADLLEQCEKVTKEPYGTLEDIKEIGLFYQRVAQDPEAYGVPKEIYERADGKQDAYIHAWAWINIESFFEKDPVAHKVAANKRAHIAAWQWAERVLGKESRPAGVSLN